MTALTVAALVLAIGILIAPGPTTRLHRNRRVHPDAVESLGGRAGVLAGVPRDSVIAAGVGAIALITAGPAAALAVFMAGGLLVSRRGRRRRQHDRRRHGAAMTAALETLVGELTVGAHPVAAFTTVSQECGRAGLGAQFGAVAARARLGSDVVSGLRLAASTSVVPEYWTRVAVCWQLAAEQGLPMIQLMRAAQRDIADRQRFADRVEAGAAGARATATILACLPVLGVVLGQLVGAHPLRFLLGSGGPLLLAGVMLGCAGVWWADRIIDGVTR